MFELRPGVHRSYAMGHRPCARRCRVMRLWEVVINEAIGDRILLDPCQGELDLEELAVHLDDGAASQGASMVANVEALLLEELVGGILDATTTQDAEAFVDVALEGTQGLRGDCRLLFGTGFLQVMFIGLESTHESGLDLFLRLWIFLREGISKHTHIVESEGTVARLDGRDIGDGEPRPLGDGLEREVPLAAEAPQGAVGSFHKIIRWRDDGDHASACRGSR